jgi:hypothetical protein
MEYSTESDPATWDRASYLDDPIDNLEGPEWPQSSEFREACIRLMRVLACIDAHMSNHRDARLAWIQIAIGLGLGSVSGHSTTAIAAELGVTKQAVSRGTVSFLRMVHLPPAFGLKSETARKTYQSTNGYNHSDRDAADAVTVAEPTNQNSPCA